jgi:hypothetical protein
MSDVEEDDNSDYGKGNYKLKTHLVENIVSFYIQSKWAADFRKYSLMSILQ